MTTAHSEPRPGCGDRSPAVSITSPFLLTEDPSISESIAALGEPRCYRAGEFVYRQGSTSEYFYQVVHGRLRLYLTRADGSERVLSYAEPGAGFGESTCFDGLPRYASCVAITDSEVLAISLRAIVDAGRHRPDILLEMTRRVSRKSRLFAMHVAADGLPAHGRVALLFDHLVEAYGVVQADGSVRLRVQYSLDELALLVGVTRVTMSRVLAQFVEDDIVRRHGRELVLPNLPALREVAGDYRP
ncbi:Crp/Fnr family transcriptional regulator [Amycolatopsis nalaikhensis]|uniref:Crp/Fnr family transcriptional regulator n=1 Tax=Amycolatopsis nalaikhensis TaxID=715472 RepID=A0ABY8XEN1_9PSEU|nr:Crp/Fnr family transcriptional regulator [Amycolatopsis sp. 2-2]WIV54055.1 Crp/Fnr family transcriptional regulator [Amycolatopsis sp. 2-2]